MLGNGLSVGGGGGKGWEKNDVLHSDGVFFLGCESEGKEYLCCRMLD